MDTDPEKYTKKHAQLIHSDNLKVLSHVQRTDGDWIINTLMVEGCDAPFRYRRKKAYKKLVGQRVNLTYYPITETVAGFDFEIMKVVRVRIA
ncbi:MAG: hypothetical protein V3W04_12320 [Gammaproteobacteria bacterium]